MSSPYAAYAPRLQGVLPSKCCKVVTARASVHNGNVKPPARSHRLASAAAASVAGPWRLDGGLQSGCAWLGRAGPGAGCRSCPGEVRHSRAAGARVRCSVPTGASGPAPGGLFRACFRAPARFLVVKGPPGPVGRSTAASSLPVAPASFSSGPAAGGAAVFGPSPSPCLCARPLVSSRMQRHCSVKGKRPTRPRTPAGRKSGSWTVARAPHSCAKNRTGYLQYRMFDNWW